MWPNKEHIDKETFKQIFHDHWEDFKAIHPRYDTPYYDEVVQKMLDCGDPEKMGFAQYRCTSCGETRRVAFSCKSSFCLSCATPYTERWVEFISRRLFPGVVYRHIVLTVPEFLRIWFYRNPRLLRHLIRAGNKCLREVFKECAGVKLDIGTIVVLQTAGRPGNYHPHLHILVTGGGLDPKDQWRNVSFIPFKLIHRKWQYHLLKMLRKKVKDPAIRKDVDTGWNNYPKGFVAFVDKGKVPPGGKGLATYLAKYLVSPPISVRRIESYDRLSVNYWYKDHRTEQVEHETLPVLRFIGRMVQHILPKGFQRISYYGLHSNPRYEKMRSLLARILPTGASDDPLGFRVIPRLSFADLFQKTFGKNPLLCPRCGQHMELESLHHPKYGTIKSFWDELFHEVACEQPFRSEEKPLRGPLDPTEQVVQVPLPFV
jgi:hypothetical protein